MLDKYIGFGTLSLHYLYILYCFISNSLGNIILSFGDYYDEAEYGLFFFSPELNRHKIIKNLYKNLGHIIFGFIFYFIFLIKKKKNALSKEDNNNNNLNIILIYNKTNYNPKNITIHLLLTCFIFAFHSELNTILGSFGFSGFDFWILNIIFTLVFMNYFFKIKFYKHQIYSLAFNFCTNLILLIICTFVKVDDNTYNDYENIKNILKYKEVFIAIILIYALNSLIISYSRVKAKILMELNYISPYKIIILTGCFGFFLCIISLTFSSIFKCNDNLKNFKKCKVKVEVNDEEICYFDSIPIYFNKLIINEELYQILLEILVINPLYLFAKFMKFYFEILMIYYLNPIFILISNSTFYGISYLFKAILNEDHNIKFILGFLADIFSILSYLIYLEIIELRFCGLSTNTKKNIEERGRLDSFMIECGDINDSNESSDFNE